MAKTYQWIIDVQAKIKGFSDAMSKLKADAKKTEEQVQKISEAGSSVTNMLGKVGAAAGIAFGVNEVVKFTGEIINLSGEVAGVKRAFDLIGNEDYLESLRRSTHGTVSDLELMKRAVSANNFGIPLENLGSLFEFAAARAQATGQSVDYLVDSIVTGIGRKSPLILDNLGITAVALKEKLGGVSTEAASIGQIAAAVGSVASEALQKGGGYAETTATKVQALSAQWANFKDQLSQSESVINAISGGTNILSSSLTQLDGILKGAQQRMQNSHWYDGFIAPFKGAQLVFGMFGDSMDAVQEKADKAAKSTESLAKAADIKKQDGAGAVELAEKIKKVGLAVGGLKEEVTKWDKENKAPMASIKTAYEQLSERITTLIKKQQDLATAGKDISGITAQIAAMEEQKQKIDELIEASNKVSGYKIGDAIGTGKLNSGLKPEMLDKNEDTKLGLVIDPAAIQQTKSAYQNALDEIARSEEAFLEKHQAVQGALEGGFMAIGQSIVNGLGFAKDGLGGFVSTMMETATKLIAMAFSQSVANSIVGATQSGAATGPAAIITTPAFIATAIGGILSAFAAIPKFAAGGIAYGPTLGMFGEYPGASSNPEIVAPLSRLRDLIQPAGQATVIMPAGVEIDGYKLRVLLKRVDKSINSRT